jgi:hypothetical protein
MSITALTRAQRWLLVAMLVTGVGVPATLCAQEEPPVTPLKKPPVATPPALAFPKDLDKVIKASKGKFEFGAMKTGNFADAADQANAKALYDAYVNAFRAKETIPGLWKLRQDLRTQLVAAGNAPQQVVHPWQRQYLFDELKKLVADDQQPLATRVNALAMIGDLNQKEVSPPPPNPPQSAPVPLAAALPYLLQTFEDANMPSAMRVTALRGLMRHVQLAQNQPQGQPPVDFAAVRAAMLKAAVSTQVAKDCTDEGHEWIRRRAVELLAILKEPAAVKVMIDVVADEKASFAFRCEAARGLGMLPLKEGDPNVGNVAAARHLGELAALVAESSNERFTELALNVGDYATDRRRLYEYLDCVRIGLAGASRDAKAPSGIRAATPAADAKVATDLLAQIDPLVKSIDPQKDPRNDKFTNEELADTAAEFAESVRRAGLASLGVKPKPKKAAEPANGKDPKSKDADPQDAKSKAVKLPPPVDPKTKVADPKAQPAKASP